MVDQQSHVCRRRELALQLALLEHRLERGPPLSGVPTQHLGGLRVALRLRHYRPEGACNRRVSAAAKRGDQECFDVTGHIARVGWRDLQSRVLGHRLDDDRRL